MRISTLKHPFISAAVYVLPVVCICWTLLTACSFGDGPSGVSVSNTEAADVTASELVRPDSTAGDNEAATETLQSETDTATGETSAADGEEKVSDSAVWDKAETVLPVDFDALRGVNPDIYAWLTVDGTPIDFPILQSPYSNDYYLTHSADGSESPYGAVFTENYNSRGFDDYMTVLYGHSSGAKAMFNSLIYFTDPDYFNSHRTVTVYTEDKTLTYKTFAAYIWDDRHILHNIDFSSAVYRSVYLNYVRAFRSMNSVIADDTTPSSKDRLLTLSCCTSRDGERMLLQAVLINESNPNTSS